LVHIYPNIFETKRHQNHQSPSKGIFILPCEKYSIRTRVMTNVGIVT